MEQKIKIGWQEKGFFCLCGCMHVHTTFFVCPTTQQSFFFFKFLATKTYIVDLIELDTTQIDRAKVYNIIFYMLCPGGVVK
jgi:hypothetical protein